jgi:cytochrome oxidase Cu insertion factor (SCO1/SenC/PrrC family)/thiol-disulfide isomerase/thioredoxin
MGAVGLSAIQGGTNSPAASVSGAQLPGISAATANLLSLAPVTCSTRLAPDFQLTDQNGRPLSLGQFQGTAVVLSFNDDQCTDVCTLLAEDIARADQDLGTAGRGRVVFLSVNVNPFYPQERYVQQWSDNHDLAGLPNWYFGTGPAPTLRAIWKNYGVYVGADPKTKNVTHASVIELVGPHGYVRGAADFGQNAVDVAPYSHGLAQAAIDLLPAAQRTPVLGPQAGTGHGVGAGLGQQAPTFRLPLLANPPASVGLASLRGQPVVLNFRASTCLDCRGELDAFAQISRADHKIRFLGTDVADPSPSAGADLARQAKIAYPIVTDRSGQIASAYRITGLPTTVYLDPGGHVAVYHPGAMTAEQLRYTLAQFFPNDTPQGD